MNSSEYRSQTFAILLSFSIGIVMLLIKWYAYSITGSTAIFSDAAESVVHIIGVGFAVFSMWLSRQPADKGHPYGHDKISFFSAGSEGGLIVLAALYIIYISIKKLISCIELSNLDKGTFFTLSAAIINIFLGGYLVWKGKRTKSIILIANGKHVLADSWTSFGIVIGLVLTLITHWLAFDPIIAIIAALNILWAGGKLIRQSTGGLMDEGTLELRKSILKILDYETAKRNLQYHELRYRESGNAVWVEFHLLFTKGTLLEDAHKSATEIEELLKLELSSTVNIITHLEPLEMHKEHHKKTNL